MCKEDATKNKQQKRANTMIEACFAEEIKFPFLQKALPTQFAHKKAANLCLKVSFMSSHLSKGGQGEKVFYMLLRRGRSLYMS